MGETRPEGGHAICRCVEGSNFELHEHVRGEFVTQSQTAPSMSRQRRILLACGLLGMAAQSAGMRADPFGSRRARRAQAGVRWSRRECTALSAFHGRDAKSVARWQPAGKPVL